MAYNPYSITLLKWEDIATAESSEFGEYERTGEDMRELTYNWDLTGLLQAADQFVWWISQHVGPHERPSLDARLRFDYAWETVYGEDGVENYTNGETAYTRVTVLFPEGFTDRGRLAFNAAVERALNKLAK